MLTDYPEIINKFSLLLSTGMTTKSVWERIVKNYEEHKVCTESGGHMKRCAIPAMRCKVESQRWKRMRDW